MASGSAKGLPVEVNLVERSMAVLSIMQVKRLLGISWQIWSCKWRAFWYCRELNTYSLSITLTIFPHYIIVLLTNLSFVLQWWRANKLSASLHVEFNAIPYIMSISMKFQKPVCMKFLIPFTSTSIIFQIPVRMLMYNPYPEGGFFCEE